MHKVIIFAGLMAILSVPVLAAAAEKATRIYEEVKVVHNISLLRF